MKLDSKMETVPPGYFATVYIGLGEKDNALDALTQACDQHARMMLWLGVDPRFESKSLRNRTSLYPPAARGWDCHRPLVRTELHSPRQPIYQKNSQAVTVLALLSRFSCRPAR